LTKLIETRGFNKGGKRRFQPKKKKDRGAILCFEGLISSDKGKKRRGVDTEFGSVFEATCQGGSTRRGEGKEKNRAYDCK